MGKETEKDLKAKIDKAWGLTADAKVKAGHSMMMVMYDISDSYVRNALHSMLMRAGFMRQQMSVYIGCRPSQVMTNLKCKATELIETAGSDTDSVIFVPITNETIQNMTTIGRQTDLEEVTNTTRPIIC